MSFYEKMIYGQCLCDIKNFHSRGMGRLSTTCCRPDIYLKAHKTFLGCKTMGRSVKLNRCFVGGCKMFVKAFFSTGIVAWWLYVFMFYTLYIFGVKALWVSTATPCVNSSHVMSRFTRNFIYVHNKIHIHKWFSLLKYKRISTHCVNSIKYKLISNTVHWKCIRFLQYEVTCSAAGAIIFMSRTIGK